MNQFRQSLEDLFNKEEMKQKIKDVEEYYNREVEDLRNNSIMNKLNELMGIRSAYANDTILDQQPLRRQPEVNKKKRYQVLNELDNDFEFGWNLSEYPEAFSNLINYRNYFQNKKLNDKYKHAMINYAMAQNGPEYYNAAVYASNLKENADVLLGNNTLKESSEDMLANIVGRKLGKKYPSDSCDTMVQQYYKKTY